MMLLEGIVSFKCRLMHVQIYESKAVISVSMSTKGFIFIVALLKNK